MDTITLEEFLQSPTKYIRNAMNGDYCKVTGDNGCSAIIIDEVEWTMLCQALKLCVVNPQWTTNT